MTIRVNEPTRASGTGAYVPNLFRSGGCDGDELDTRSGLVKNGDPADVTPLPVSQSLVGWGCLGGRWPVVSAQEEGKNYPPPIMEPVYRDQFNPDGSVREPVAEEGLLWRRPVTSALIDVAVAGFERSHEQYIMKPTTSYAAGSREGLLGIFKTSDADYELATTTDRLGVSFRRRLEMEKRPEEVFAKAFKEVLESQFNQSDNTSTLVSSELLAATVIQVIGGKAIILSAFQGGFNVFRSRKSWRGGFGTIVKSVPMSRDVDNGLLRGELSDLQAGDKIVLTGAERITRKDVLAGRACVEAMANSIANSGGPTIVASINPTSPHSR